MMDILHIPKKYWVGSLLLLALVCIVISIPACKGKSDSEEANFKGKYQIALVMKTLTNPFFVTMEKGAREAEKELGIELIVKTGAQETSIEQQISIVERLIDEKVDAIVIAPAGSVELVPVIKRAVDAGIKVVNIDNQLDKRACERAGLKGVPYISVDNEEGAYLAASHIAKMVSGSAEAIILEGIPTAKNAQDRARGAKKAFAEIAGIKVVESQSANWKIDEAYEVAKKLFPKHPNLKLLFCANDMMAMGAIQYLNEKGNKKVLVAAFDNLDEVQPLIKDGSLKATVDQQADRQGFMGIDTAVKMLKGEAVSDTVLIPVKLITGQ